MLQLVTKLSQLDFRQLMQVYEEGNLSSGAQLYAHEPQSRWQLLAEQEFYNYLRQCFFTQERAVYAVWTEQGRYVSALRLEPYNDGLLLAALETAPDRRRQGYATALIRAVLERFGAEPIYSHVAKRNTASLRTHEKCGFYRVLEHAVYADGSVLTGSCTFCSRPPEK